jgi:hypothetical protein
VIILLVNRSKLVKSATSLLRCVVFVSISALSLFVIHQLSKEQRRSGSRITLKEGQTILAVADQPPSLVVYIGEDEKQ